MINYPNKPWEDGQQFKTVDSNGEEVVGTYDASKNAWSFTRLQEGVPGGGIGFVTTEDVNTTPGVPGAPDGWAGLDLTEDVLDLKTQKQVNWFLSEAIVSNKQELESLLWIGEDAPDERETTYIFWWHTLSLELLVKHNDQWFPVAIPPAQVETLRQEIDAIYDSVGNARRDIVLNKNDIDTLALDVDGKIATLEEELEQLAPSLERGSWTFTLNHPPGPGEYTMISAFLDETDQEALCDQTYAECQAAGGGDPVAIQACTRAWNDCRNAIDGSQVITTDDWTQCDELVFNNVDMNGVTHGWAGIDSDHYIDVFNMNDENYMVGDIATHGGGTFSFDLVSSRGVASGPATIKIFKTEGTIDFDQYIRKTGDTMTGTLNVDVGNSTALFVRSNLTSSNSIFYVRNGDNTTQFRVTADGKVQAGNQATTAFMATDPHDVITKKYADQYCRVPTAYQYELKYMETPTDAKAMELARVPGQWAKTNNGIWINRYDKNELVDLSPYFTSNQGSFTTPGNVEEDIEGEVSTFGDTLVLDYQGLYDNMRGFLSVYQKYNRERLGLRRMYAIPSVTWYKNEPFIKLTWSKNFNLDSLYYSECFLSLPGII